MFRTICALWLLFVPQILKAQSVEDMLFVESALNVEITTTEGMSLVQRYGQRAGFPDVCSFGLMRSYSIGGVELWVENWVINLRTISPNDLNWADHSRNKIVIKGKKTQRPYFVFRRIISTELDKEYWPAIGEAAKLENTDFETRAGRSSAILTDFPDALYIEYFNPLFFLDAPDRTIWFLKNWAVICEE